MISPTREYLQADYSVSKPSIIVRNEPIVKTNSLVPRLATGRDRPGAWHSPSTQSPVFLCCGKVNSRCSSCRSRSKYRLTRLPIATHRIWSCERPTGSTGTLPLTDTLWGQKAVGSENSTDLPNGNHLHECSCKVSRPLAMAGPPRTGQSKIRRRLFTHASLDK